MMRTISSILIRYLECKLEYEIKVYSWCLMTHHVHLISDPQINSKSIGLLMKKLVARPTRRVNKLERRTGSLWEGRFKLSPIDTDNDLLQCFRYVELNPVKARMTADASGYRWSSFLAKVG
jgi:putative transposase